MYFLVEMNVQLPSDVDATTALDLRAAEAAATATLADEGSLMRLWRSVPDERTWSLWQAQDAVRLNAELDRLPLRRFMTVDVRQLIDHPHDPHRLLKDAEQPSLEAKPTMSAIVKTGHGEGSVALLSREVPSPGPGHVLVEVHAAGVCGTDLHIAQDRYPTRPPVVMGHEVAGKVVTVGDGVRDDWVGVRVACETHHQVCSCDYCRDGRRNLCLNKTSMGSFVDGGFATHVVVPEALLHRIPDHLGDHAAALSEPLACVCHCLLDPPVVNAGDRVLVTGPGPVGLLAAQVARAAGGRVTVVGLPTDESRLAVAERLGLPTATSAEPETYDVALECSGSAGGAALALDAVRRGGRYVSIGIFGAPVTLPFDRVLYKELTVTSGFAATRMSWQRARALLDDGLVDLEALVSGVAPLSAWAAVFADLTRSDGMKIVFDPRLPS
jgi:L-iditol 2-dehydrogenase